MSTPRVQAMQSVVTGEGEPLVLVPGGLTGWLSWQPHAEQLAVDYQVVRVQLLSVDLGLKGAPLPEDYSVLTEKEALRHTLDSLGTATADIAAWSYGGLVALVFALDHPERVRSLALIEPAAAWVLRSRGLLEEELQADQRVFQLFGPDDITEDQLADFLHMAGLLPQEVNPRELPQWPVWVEHRQSLRMGDAPYRFEGDIEQVRRFQKPVLLVTGEGSTPIDSAIVNVLAEEFPNVRVERLPGGHAAHIVSMEPFMELFRAFLREA